MEEWSFLYQIGSGNTVFALLEVVLEDMVFYFLAYSTTNTRFNLPICSQIQALDF
jgi:hypothetical protein